MDKMFHGKMSPGTDGFQFQAVTIRNQSSETKEKYGSYDDFQQIRKSGP